MTRLNKRLLIDGKPLALASDFVRLRLNEVGEGFFEVLEQPRAGGQALVEFYAGVSGKEEYLVFTGAMREVKQMGEGRFRVTARELCMVLELHIVLNMGRCTAREIIAKIEQKTGLKFLLPKGAYYLNEARLQFSHYGSAADAIKAVSEKWDLKEMVWFQLPDGRMYWGHWTQGPYTRAPLPIEAKLISELNDQSHTLVLPYIPALRPGMLVESDFRFRIDGLVFTGEKLKVNWTKV